MFIVSKIAIAIISPLGSALLGGLLALLFSFAGFRRFAWLLGVLSLAWIWAWSLPVTSYALRGTLENQHPPAAVETVPEAGAIVVLGGGTWPMQFGQPYPNLGAASDRAWHGARLYKAGKAPLLVLTGGHARGSAPRRRRRVCVVLWRIWACRCRPWCWSRQVAIPSKMPALQRTCFKTGV